MNKVSTLFNFLLDTVEFNYKRNLIKILRENFGNDINVVFDVGAHKGETSEMLLKNFNINKIHLFEPQIDNFLNLERNLKGKYNKNKLILNNFALGEENKKSQIKTVLESSSSTINSVNTKTKYYKRKEKILNIFNANSKIKTSEIEVRSSNEYIVGQRINKIDLIKIDTEGYEYYILKNIKNYLKNIKLILFEHHYDLMIIKNYKFKDINNLLVSNNFKQIFKSKMMFRKSFEYIYINKSY